MRKSTRHLVFWLAYFSVFTSRLYDFILVEGRLSSLRNQQKEIRLKLNATLNIMVNIILIVIISKAILQ